MNVEPITVVVRVHRFDPLPDPASAAPSAAPSGAPSVIKDATRRDSEARRDRPGRPGRRHVSPFARLEKNHDADDASQTGTDGARKNTEENGTSGAAPARPRRGRKLTIFSKLKGERFMRKYTQLISPLKPPHFGIIVLIMTGKTQCT